MHTSPLSPTPSAALNSSTPSAIRYEAYEVRSVTRTTTQTPGFDAENEDGSSPNSSPFMSHINAENGSPSPTSRGPSPPKVRPMSRVISGSELSPLKIVQQQQQQQQNQQTPVNGTIEEAALPTKSMPPPPLPQSPRKMTSPIKRFPVKIRNLAAAVNEPPAQPQAQASPPSSSPRPSSERNMSLQDAIRENEGLKHAIEIFEDDANDLADEIGSNGGGGGDDTMLMGSSPPEQGHQAQEQRQDQYQGYEDEDEHAGMDDTMISTFSAFSAVPNLTMLSQMRSNSPNKFSTMTGGATPRASRGEPQPTPMRTPRANGQTPDRYDTGNTTNLLDFTDQLRFNGYSSQRGNPSPLRGPNGMVAATPQRNNLVNLLDFDIPPMPTPRSIPTVTPRELESLKSGFLSEISSLKASLSGKEAEVLSLKTAVGDAEKRVGECMEQLREVQGTHGALVAERDSWEKRGREMEVVLRKVKEEIVLSQREREELEFKLDESEKRREAAEMMAQDAESKMAGMRAGKASAEAAAAAESGGRSPVPVGSNKEVEMAVERVARELHALYKSKHETKVAALKKSYENRWEKKVRELQMQVDELARENEELRVGRDATMTKVDLARLAELEDERKAEKAKDAAHIKELEAEVEKLEAVTKTVKDDNDELRRLLEKERVEKGELVMLAEEMMNMQSFVAPEPAAPANPPPAAATPSTAKTARGRGNTSSSMPESPAATRTPARLSMGPPPRTTPATARASHEGGAMRLNPNRLSGLRAPTSGLGLSKTESKIGRMPHERTKSAAIGGSNVTGVPRPGSGLGMRNGLMSSIEKMGSYRGVRGE
ncbi:hypothetical protein QBC34DRAFT_414394 [Podospora aff. communis PSN243]|uniref:Uncharacterized protein n=1 Tax=Podospora aff. communis PSN243 TaxID=3040156 RepID=A0AAV9G9K8_9PEZI|nr:hypothetical protein QBC34DRAFT_414394 [Podospora aff. communis PSN243]